MKEERATLSIMPVQFPDGSFGVELVVTGLVSLNQAQAACEHLERLFCAEEIKPQ